MKKDVYDELVKKVNGIWTNGTSNLVKKAADYNSKIDKLEKKIMEHDKYVTSEEFKLTSKYLATRLKQADLEIKSDIANFVKKTDFDEKLKNE